MKGFFFFKLHSHCVPKICGLIVGLGFRDPHQPHPFKSRRLRGNTRGGGWVAYLSRGNLQVRSEV